MTNSLQASNYFKIVDSKARPIDVTPYLLEKEGVQESLEDFTEDFIREFRESPDVHWMIDLETLGLEPESALVQVGMAPFFLEAKKGLATKTFRGQSLSIVHKAILKIEGQNRKIDQDTVSWWETSNRQNLHLLKSGDTNLVDELLLLKKILSRDSNIWANSPRFDVQLLCDCFRQYKEQVGSFPVSFRNEWDVRTISKLAGLTSTEMKPVYSDSSQFWSISNKHDALADCLTQIFQVQTAYERLHV